MFLTAYLLLITLLLCRGLVRYTATEPGELRTLTTPQITLRRSAYALLLLLTLLQLAHQAV